MRKSEWITLIGAFFFLGFLIYAQSLGNSFVRWDDGLLIYENPLIRGINLKNLWGIFTTYDPELYIPLTLFSYQIDYMIAGTSPGFYHLHSLLLHIVNAILVVWVIDLLVKNRWVAVVTGLLFLIHPLNTEAVAWASGRKDLLSTLWMMVSLGCFLEYKKGNRRILRNLGILGFLLALLAKVTVLTLPAVLVIVAILKRWKLDRRFWIDLSPFILLSAIFAVIAYLGKTGVIDSSTPLEKILIAPMSTVFYLQKLIIPTGLAVIYPFTGAVELLTLRIAIPILICLILTIVGLKNYKSAPLLFFCLAFFAITLSPSLLNFSKGDFLYFASDRYAYIPSIGILLMFATLLSRLPQRIQFLACFAILACFAFFTHNQSLVWADSETLFTHNLKHYPAAHTAHNNLGNIYRTKGDVASAIAEYEEARDLSLAFGRGESALYGRSKILSNMASAYRESGDNATAMQLLHEAEELNPKNQFVPLGKGIIYASQGNITEAEQQYKKAIEMDPTFTSVKINLGSLYVQTGRHEDAISILEDAISWNPFYPQAYYNLGSALRGLERNREAKEMYEKAVELEPAFVAARINLGILYAERRDIEEAIQQFEQVLRYDPQNARALSALQQLRVR